MPRRRKPKYNKKSGVFATSAGFEPSGPGGTRVSVLAAAEIIAAAARAKASRFSARIPKATGVVAFAEHQAMVVTDGHTAPNAAPFEFGERHPCNLPNLRGPDGRPTVWRKQPMRAYMSNGARGASDAAAERYGIEEARLLAEEFGFNE